MNRSLALATGGIALAGISFLAGLRVGVAQSPGWKPMIIHVPKLTAATLPPKAPNQTVQAKMLAAADGATLQVQLGAVPKHYHANANEIQYIIAGRGRFWLDDGYKTVGPGDLIIIPRGVAHGATTTAFKALSIKTPPQAADDVHPVP